MDKPAAAEFRALPTVAAVGLVPMVQTVQAAPTLWKDPTFVGGFIVLSALTAFGTWSFFQHWKARAVGPGLIVIAYTLVSFGQSAVFILIVLMLAFVVSAYLISPDRVNKPALSNAGDQHAVLAIPRTPDELIEEANRKAEMEGLLHRLEVAEGLRDGALEQCTSAKNSLDAEREANRQLRTSLDQSGTEHARVQEKLDTIAPLVRLHQRIIDCEERLASFRGELTEQEANIEPSDPVAEWLKNTPVNQARFSANYRPELVKLTLDLKQNYGWIIPDITDEKLTQEVYGSLGLDRFIAGVAEAKQRVENALLTSASKLDV